MRGLSILHWNCEQCLNDGSPEVRDAAFLALAAIAKVCILSDFCVSRSCELVVLFVFVLFLCALSKCCSYHISCIISHVSFMLHHFEISSNLRFHQT